MRKDGINENSNILYNYVSIDNIRVFKQMIEPNNGSFFFVFVTLALMRRIKTVYMIGVIFMAELLEMRSLVSSRLYEILVDKIRGYVIVEFVDETLSVSIIFENMGWRIWFSNFDDYLIRGYSLNVVADIVLRHYKESVIDHYIM